MEKRLVALGENMEVPTIAVFILGGPSTSNQAWTSKQVTGTYDVIKWQKHAMLCIAVLVASL